MHCDRFYISPRHYTEKQRKPAQRLRSNSITPVFEMQSQAVISEDKDNNDNQKYRFDVYLKSQTCSLLSVPLEARIVSLCGDH